MQRTGNPTPRISTCCTWTWAGLHGNTCDETQRTADAGNGSANPTRLTAPSIGGCFDLENPFIDARTAQPQWIPGSPSAIQLTKTDELSEAIPFSLWRLPGRKTLLCDGGRILVSAQVNEETIRMTLNGNIHDGAAFACAIPATGAMQAACSHACRIVDLLTTAAPPRSCSRRPNRTALVHMRTLQAVDGDAAGATHREIAEALFGQSDTWQRWGQNSELRAQIRYLLRRGHALINGDYRQLITRTGTTHHGEFTSHSEAP